MNALDAETYWRLYRCDRGALYTALFERYPHMPPHYVMHFVDHGAAGHEGNARILTYVEADLGAAQRGLDALELLAGGIDVLRKRCLDIGCNNGAFLRAAQERGARGGVGVDVSAYRLAAARNLCRGHPIEFLELDASVDPLPGPFDVIFCRDVLEHVSDWRRLLEHAAKALSPDGTMWLSLHNARHPSVVLSEPHYGVPGLVLLPPGDAAACWGRVRATMGNAIDYEVTSWPLYRDIRAVTDDLGLTTAPWVDCAPAFDSAFWTVPRADLTTIGATAAAELARLGIAESDAERLREAVERYQAEAVREFHDTADRLRSGAADERLDFFMTYHAQPLNLLLRHAGATDRPEQRHWQGRLFRFASRVLRSSVERVSGTSLRRR
jgi:SAM-dependent methyltransferase